jgi:D-lactate dehydrogenase
VKAERARSVGWPARALAAALAGRFGMAVAATRGALALAHGFGVRRLPGTEVPLPGPGRPLPRRWPTARGEAPTVAYLPTCIARATGPDDVPGAFANLCDAAGIGVIVPETTAHLCCGQPFASKGLIAAQRLVAERTAAALLALGSPVVVTDTSTCAAQLASFADVLPRDMAAQWKRLRVIDPATFAASELVPRLGGRLAPQARRVVLHPTCSDQKRSWDAPFAAAVRAASTSATVPTTVGCCGMAGDRGWLVPELTASATIREAHAARDSGAPEGICTSSLCGQAMTAATGIPYRHVWSWMRDGLAAGES